MGTIFILAGSLLGLITAIYGVSTGGMSLLAGLGLWVASGPAAAMLVVISGLLPNRAPAPRRASASTRLA